MPRRVRPKGRPDVYTAEIHAKIIEALEVGVPKLIAAHYAGINHQSLHTWLALGDTGEEPYAQLLLDVNAARAKDCIRNQSSISRAAVARHGGDWKAAAWNLEKKFPRLYGAAAELIQELDIEDARAERQLERDRARAEKPQSPWIKPMAKTA